MHPINQRTFLALVLAQAAHFAEEYYFRLYDVFAPASLVSGVFGDNLAVGVGDWNSAFLTFGLWCYFYRVRPDAPDVRKWVWIWVIVEIGNGAGHIAIAIDRGRYFPGVYTAPVLLTLGCFLAWRMLRD